MSADNGRIVGAYRLERVLGRGGMGVVHIAVQQPLGRRVAVKLVGAGHEPGARERFRREWGLAAAVDHPNVLPIYDAGEDDGVLFMAMRLVEEGSDLGALLAREGPLAPRRAAGLVAQVASALDAAHAHGLIHRDVKPANILVRGSDEDEHAYLSDFGAVKRQLSSQPITEPGHWLGTLGYVAPEQLRGEPVDGRADLYALGCVLFEAVTGRVPFPRDDDVAVMWAHLSDPPPRASELAPVPPEFDAVLARALAKDPARRYPSGASFGRAALTAARAPTPTSAATAVRVARAGTPASRRVGGPRRRLTLAATAAAALIVAAASAFALRGDEPTRPKVSAPVTAGAVVGKPIEVGGQPLNLAPAGDTIWVTLAGKSQGLARVDPAASARAGDIVPMAEMPYGVARDGDAVWVSTPSEGTVRRIDARSGRFAGRPLRVGGAPVGIAVGAGAVWVAQLEAGTVTRIDPRTLSRKRIRVGRNPVDVAVGAGSVWVTVAGGDTLARIDPRTNALVGKRIPVGDNPTGLAVGDGVIWVALRDDSAVVRVDARSNRMIGRPIPVGLDPYDVAVGAGGVWVTSHGEDSVRRLDPKTGEMVGKPLRVGDGARDVAVAGGAVWVANTTDGTVSHIEPTR